MASLSFVFGSSERQREREGEEEERRGRRRKQDLLKKTTKMTSLLFYPTTENLVCSPTVMLTMMMSSQRHKMGSSSIWERGGERPRAEWGIVGKTVGTLGSNTENTNSQIMPESLKTPTLGDNGKLHRSTWPPLNTHIQWQNPNKMLCYSWNLTHYIPSVPPSLWPAADGLVRAALNVHVMCCTTGRAPSWPERCDRCRGSCFTSSALLPCFK